MIIGREIEKIIEKLTGYHIYRFLPRGIDVFADITEHLPLLQVDIVFDIGANVGQSAKSFLKKFPKSRIYCFEPVGETFRQLQENLKDYQNIHSFKLAFGAVKGKGRMVLQGSSNMFFLLNTAKDVSINDKTSFEDVNLTTVDEFCADKGIHHINYLKIDTEGGDIDVLTGAKNMLNKQQIDLVQVEAGMNVGNKRHVPFEELKRFLEGSGYFLFGLYDQVHERHAGEPHLRRTNPLFISEAVIKTNRK
jgi:FkbM family methyltransferase